MSATREGCALVTGASRGIGAATARMLAADGWPVGVAYRGDAAGAESTVGAIEDAGGTATALQADVTAPDAADLLFRPLEERYGRVLILVNNAGARADALAPQIDDEAWNTVLETNLSAAFRLTRRALGPMLRERFGRVVNVASVVGLRANAGQSNYSAAKAGLLAFTRTVAVEVARRSITVNAVAPGFVETEMTADVKNDIVGAIPARRAGSPEDVAACIRFLASEEAAYVTGATLVVDGGLSA